ncbi:SusC/RagA family TonB-linked outer membrane protein [Taibaiella koreensis]|uniref:SusC/RagA family TonB-linked outer membrane protein n=1 Tax=Taibaiella koreensis TaxID=1268548 RepID=UPI0013C2D5B4|nr:SusC/RagA family TonB-linked outer membrane protein [Taibaiella koreensis]
MNLKLCPAHPLGQKRCGTSSPLLVMRLIVFLTLCLSLHTTASVGQQISLNVKDASIESVFTQIKKQTGYTFWYRDDALKNANKVTLSLKNVSLKTALEACFKDQPLSYEIVGKTIVVKSIIPTAIPQKKNNAKEDRKVTGTVTDTTGTTISGVSVRVKGTMLSTVTAADGAFSLVVPEKAVLVFTYIGFETLEVSGDYPSPIKIALHKSYSKLDEVKIIGYGITTQRLTTGSVTKITGSEIEKQPVSNPILALQGRVPGLFITQSNGLPGSGFNILIRGKNSISQGTTPLYIIDGIPFDASNPTQAVATGQMNIVNPFNSINPGDIESIEVLKDADATSIYGSRGANGVILITTKKARPGNLNVNFDLRTGWSKVARSLDLLNGQQYRAMRREALANDGVVPDINNAYDLVAFDTTIVNDFTKTLIGRTASTTNAQLRVSGGNVNTQFTAGANFFTEGTVFPGDFGSNRKSINFAVSHSSTDKKFNLQLSSSYAYNQSKLIPDDLTQRLPIPPYGFTFKDPSGRLIWTGAAEYYGNPLNVTLKHYNGFTDLVTTGVVVSYRLLPGLVLKANGGYNLLDYNENLNNPIAAQNPVNNVKGSASFGHTLTRNWSVEPQLQYSGSFKSKGRFDAVIGTSFQQNESIKDYMAGSGYVSDALINTIGGAATIKARNAYNLYHYNAIFGRLTLNWEDTYLLNFTGRRDGSSRFGPGNQFANFGSIGAGWIFSQLDFFKEKQTFLSFGKLRLSFGTSGNDQIGNYNYLDSYAPSTLTYQQALSLLPTRLFNKDYSWEQFTKLEAAVELGFFNDRFYISGNYYRNRSDNQLIDYSLPGQTGFASILLNFPGRVENKGWEIELRSDNIKSGKFSWTTNFNITVPRNRLLRFPDLANSSYANSFAIGQPLSVQFGYQYLGVDLQTGVYKVKDQNNDGVYNDKDYVIIGNTDPRFYGGFQNTFTFRGFALSVLFQFTKQMGREPIFSTSSLLGGIGNIPKYVVDNHWTKAGDQARYAKFTQAYGTELADSYDRVSNSSAQLTDASYIRLKTASLSYQFPGHWIKPARIKSLNVYLEGQNLLTISKYPGPDPEVQSTYILPPLRTITVGIKAGL